MTEKVMLRYMESSWAIVPQPLLCAGDVDQKIKNPNHAH